MSIHYTSQGHGTPVLFLHGFCESSEIWNPFIEFLPKDIKAIAVDLPGFGKSALFKKTATIDDIGIAIHNWVVSQKLDRPIVIGHSLGGYVSLAMADLFPNDYAGLVLFHSTAQADTEEKKQNRNKVMEFVRGNGIKAFVSSFTPSLFFKKGIEEVQFALRIAEQTPEETFLSYTQAMRDRPARDSVLVQSKLPIMLIAGQYDSVVPVDTLEKQSKLNPEIELEILTGVGHMGMLEAKNTAAIGINRFIQRVKSRVGR